MAWLTPTETIAVVNALEPRTPLSLRQLRYLDRLEVLRPVRAGTSPNAGRLYGPSDVALLRLIARVVAGRSYRETWAAVLYLERQIREAFTTRGPQALVFQGRKASVRPLKEAERLPGADVYDLSACVRGVDQAMRAQRSAAPEVWVGHAWATAQTLPSFALETV